ncbi:hypothetical protein B0H12DRAFT_1232097 [Mycena haematopus]|nr:hypothetical protein B0H12DRAFT_1232097 [Mycena haematopus]
MSRRRERNPSVSTPVKKDAPYVAKSRYVTKTIDLLDLEAEEVNGTADSDEEEDDDDPGFIDDSGVAPGTPIEWSRSPSPSAEVDGSLNVDEGRGDERSSSPQRASRGKGKAKESDSTLSSEGKRLNTAGSASDKRAGISSSSVTLGTDSADTQSQLEVVRSTKGPSGVVTISSDEYKEWMNYKKESGGSAPIPKQAVPSLVHKHKPKASGAQPPKGVPSPATPPKAAATSSAVKSGPSTRGRNTSVADKAANKDAKRKRPSADVDNRPQFPAPPIEAFNAKKAEAANSSPVKKIKANDVTLETKDIRRPRESPEVCQVMDVALQDDMLKTIYATGLPKLEKATLISWSAKKGPGMFKFGELAAVNPNINVETVWSFLNFVSKGRFVNLARVAPSSLEAVCQIYSNQDHRWSLSIGEIPAICISVVNTTNSSLKQISAVSGGSANRANLPLLKFITGIHMTQEFDRVVGVCGMVFDVDAMHAQISADAITFGTKAITAERLASLANTSSRQGVQTSSSKYKPSAYPTASEALPHDAEVPVYDGRGDAVNAYDVVETLDTSLPRFEENNGEIPCNSCTVVAYTVSKYSKKGRADRSDEEHGRACLFRVDRIKTNVETDSGQFFTMDPRYEPLVRAALRNTDSIPHSIALQDDTVLFRVCVESTTLWQEATRLMEDACPETFFAPHPICYLNLGYLTNCFYD